MKEVVFNKNNLTNDDIQIKEDRVKVILRNSKNEILLCKINGVYHFVGGRIEHGETINECGKREIAEETGITVNPDSFVPFLQLKQYEKNYYNSGKNCLSTITYVEATSDEPFDYDKRQLDLEESKKDFQLVYVPFKSIMDELEANREAAKKDKREFIITEMKYVISEYISYLRSQLIKASGQSTVSPSIEEPISTKKIVKPENPEDPGDPMGR